MLIGFIIFRIQIDSGLFSKCFICGCLIFLGKDCVSCYLLVPPCYLLVPHGLQSSARYIDNTQQAFIECTPFCLLANEKVCYATPPPTLTCLMTYCLGNHIWLIWVIALSLLLPMLSLVVYYTCLWRVGL